MMMMAFKQTARESRHAAALSTTGAVASALFADTTATTAHPSDIHR